MMKPIEGAPGHVEAQGIYKKYFMRGAGDMIRSWFTQVDESQILWALKDVSFQVGPGEAYAILGRNGAGKSTLLKTLAKVMSPTRGRLITQGRMTCLIEVGAGFHPELSGRENIFLHGAISGMSKAEVKRNLDSIVAYSEIEKFIDMPVKNYSSGMFTRLGFSVAVHSNPGILLVDEVLAVGDARFQLKCMKTIQQLQRDGTAVLLVSHNIFTVLSICSRGLVLEKGSVKAEGAIQDVVKVYEATSAQAAAGQLDSQAHEALSVHSVEFRNRRGQDAPEFAPGEELVLEVRGRAPQAIAHPMLCCAILNADGEGVCASNNHLEKAPPLDLTGEFTLTVTVHPPRLLPGDYIIDLIVADQGQTVTLAKKQHRFCIASGDAGLTREFYGHFLLDHTWSLEGANEHR